jgi:hypothetical protein
MTAYGYQKQIMVFVTSAALLRCNLMAWPAFASTAIEIETAAKGGDPDAIKSRYSGRHDLGKILTFGLCKAICDGDRARERRFLEIGAKEKPGFRALSPLFNRDGARQQSASIDMAFSSVIAAAEQQIEAKTDEDERAAQESKQKKAEAEVKKAEDAKWAASRAELDAEEAKRLNEQKRVDAEEAATQQIQDRNWVNLQKAAIAHDFKKASALYEIVSEDKAILESQEGIEAISADLLSKRGKMVYLAVTFDTNAPGGVMAMVGDSSDRVFVSGIRPGTLVSGEKFYIMAIIQGTYTYRTISGATNTVPSVKSALKF